MVQQESMRNLQQFGAQLLTEGKAFASTHRRQLQTAGLITAAVIIGGTGGYLLAKGALVTKGIAVVKSGVAVMPTAATQNTAGSIVALQNGAALLNNSLVSGNTLVAKVITLFNGLSTNAVPLTAGVIGGGTAGVGATRYQVKKVQETLAAQTTTAQSERTRLENALASATSELNALQTKLAAQPVAPMVQDRLEEIKGIGHVFAQKLNAAGIYTFADLAAQTPERLREIIGANRASNTVQPADWIEQARQLHQSRQ